ncbi:MAG: serine protease inhibitor [Fimbriimonadales bacterium]|nr:MAG: serine protease inhibitor [Fimbriimonadales bacterium]
MKPWAFAVLAISIALMGGIWLATSRNQPNLHADQTQTTWSELVPNFNQFAFNLLKELTRPEEPAAQQRPATAQQPPSNQVFSPLSVQFVLVLFLNGADGQTRAEIAQALGVPSTALDSLNQFHSELRKALEEPPGSNLLVLANSLWVRPSDRVHADFSRMGEAFYALETHRVDFTKPEEAARRINEWSEQKTQGFIPEIVQPHEIDTGTILGIANALYLRGFWAQPFKVADYAMEFVPEVGHPVRVRPMEAELSQVAYGQMDLCEIVGLPYQEGEWVCYVVLPREGLSVSQLVAQLDAARWAQYLGQLRVVERVQVVMPRFEVASEYNLIPALRRLGIRCAFEPHKAEFPRIIEGDGGYIYLFKQVCRVRVDERGTEAGAVSLALTRGQELFVADRPFLFIIQHQQTGAILFIGVVHNPVG